LFFDAGEQGFENIGPAAEVYLVLLEQRFEGFGADLLVEEQLFVVEG
jgi:hypothetical protein